MVNKKIIDEMLG